VKVKVATRSSKLSLAQTEIALSHIKALYPSLEFEVVTVKTTGDVERGKPLYEFKVSGVFEKEVNRALLRGEADIAVHSLKDIPSSIDEQLEIVFTPPRDPPNDVLIHRSGAVIPPEELPEGTVVGTSSLRRIAQLRFVNDRVRVENIRGNIDTRIRKLLSNLYDAIVVAEAGIRRLNLNIAFYRLPLIPFTPAPGQGIIAVVALRDSSIARMLRGKSDRATWSMVVAERSFIEELRVGCKLPVGGVSMVNGDKLTFIASTLSRDGSRGYWVKLKGGLEEAEGIGRKAGEIIKSEIDEVSS
jgi:hydroxymethylbilane synthase